MYLWACHCNLKNADFIRGLKVNHISSIRTTNHNAQSKEKCSTNDNTGTRELGKLTAV